ncbi:MAG: DUF5677 domain-containing protein, partial [Rhodoglobus sp.]|nr:DUF5677 domain-containing protein [Rhodoglobus sp.]
ELGTAGIRNMVAWQKAVQRDLAGRAKPAFIADCLDGRFTSLDRLAAAVPEAVDSCRTRAAELHLLPPYIDSALRSYPFRPAMWLSDGEAKAPDQDDLDLILNALINLLTDGHHESLIKCLPIWSAVQAGTLSTSKETIELLQPYPNDRATRDAADSAVRAMWGARRGLELSEGPDFYEPSIRWAKVFWGANSMTSRCLRKRDMDTEDTEDDIKEDPVKVDLPTPVNNSEPSEMPADGAHLRGLAMDLVSSYVEALETAPAHLYHHEMQEVHTGLVARAGRDVITVLGVPNMWCAEHGSHITRALVEARIYLRWMAEQDVGIYEIYQSYGYGKAKLYAKILEEIPESARRGGFADIVEELRKLSHNDFVLDYRDVDTADSFSGKSIRLMAQEAGLLDFYRQLYY